MRSRVRYAGLLTASLVAGVFVGGSGLPVEAAPTAPPGYTIDWPAVRTAPPAPREEAKGDFTCSIERNTSDTTAARLLAIAECLYPPRNLVARMAEQKGYEFGSDTVGVPLWWSKGTNERRIPYAATRAALEFYLKLTQKYRDREYREPGTQPMFSSALVYRASSARREEFELEDKSFRDVYVANVVMSWTYDNGTFLPFVASRRTVVFTPAGEILAVDGDGQATEEVSISANRDVGRQRQLMR
jgi:hypothetical protein